MPPRPSGCVCPFSTVALSFTESAVLIAHETAATTAAATSNTRPRVNQARACIRAVCFFLELHVAKRLPMSSCSITVAIGLRGPVAARSSPVACR